MTAKDTPNPRELDMPKDWTRERVRAVLDKYAVCGDHLVPIGECGCGL